jgi:hypothetical protein
MSSLDFKVHRTNFVSIKDMTHDLDISEGKWDVIFDALVEKAESIYFYGTRRWVEGADFEDLALSLGEECMIDEGVDHWRLLFRLKPIATMFHRKSLAKLWPCYEYPSIVFLQNKNEEMRLVSMLLGERYFSDIVKVIDGVVFAHQSFEPNVLWIECSSDCDLPVNN